ncbi:MULTISPECIES: TerD family protein [Clostridium]|uniref:Bacterial stress protein n=1 Tax=Clostridium novyi (strain NT) TaxID=386415 RepID=A0Q3D0_CLONN|nr:MULTISPECIES: TerD family protein [Clostridium]ABK62582.1 Bacterial stress protein [Clostridium novyi NT]KEH87588.1 chemical-damaging agent resistance protein C [Clostridium novyi A str. NCTC 538]KEH87656.1 chemical-damaging agent resistance protein C [Clostridium novyi A str. BKT29909]KEH92609.1 chemical-damaging agent resistance protein C [Clostridium botulinum C/D str. It1]KEH92897.1 chemical-damaging agent resistance protein C [Clostridium novyi A str. GD211209]
MAINLSKGQKINLSKEAPGLKEAIIGLGWDTKQFDGGFDFDLDASAFLVGANGRVNRDEDFVFYNNLEHSSGSVIHTGDNRTGEGDGDDESIVIDFSKVPESIEKIAIAVTIYDAEGRRQNFGQVSNAFVRLVNKENGEEILRYDLSEDFSIETALVFCEIYRYNGEWKFSAVGSGFQGGLAALCKNYGLEV